MSRDILVSLIDPDPGQPRRYFDEAKIAELAQSMDSNGLAVPILVRPAGDRFMIVHGERRWRAAQQLGWQAIQAEVRDVAPEEARWLSLVENVQRADLSPTEEARAFQAHLAEGITQAQLGERVGKSQSYIAQKLRLLKLPADVQSSIGAGDIAEGHARQLLRVEDANKQSELCRRAASERWAVTRVRLEVDNVLRQREKPPETPAEVVYSRFKRRGGIPGHNPYPEEEDPDRFDSPIAIKRLAISQIVDDPVMDPRTSGRDASYTEWLAEIFDTLPSIAVYLVDNEYVLADGRYRMAAAKLLGHQEIECRIYVGENRNAAELYGIVVNSGQGIPLRKRDIVHQMGIARRLGVSPCGDWAEDDGCCSVEIRPWPEVQDILPPLATHLKEALRSSIEKHGLIHPIQVLPDGRIIDGHHRWEICGDDVPYEVLDMDELAAVDHALAMNLGRRQLSNEQMKELDSNSRKASKRLFSDDAS